MIVKNLLAVGIIATAATVASAADESKATWKVGGKLRMDAVQTTTETKPATGDKSTTKSSGLLPKRAAFTLTGESNGGQDTMFMEYYAYNNTTNELAGTTMNTLNNAWIRHRLADNITASGGLINSLAQSWEFDYDAADLYLTSYTYGLAPDPTTGVQVNANFGDHNIAFQIMQGQRTTGKGAEMVRYNEGGGLTAALQYRGEINKMIRPLVTYTNVKTSGSKMTNAKGVVDTNYSRSSGYQTQMGLGVQVDTSGLVADIEYDAVKTMKMKWEAAGTEPTTNKDSDTTSIILQAKYAIGMTTPFLKFTSNATKNGQEGGASDMTGTGLAIGAEHMLDSVCRAHVVYTAQNDSEKEDATNTTKTTTTSINFGFTAAM
ncbi:MAG: hypothetical protein NTV34_04195 [Proteobacteria bacterium]|nr:hypothetical protein [Pseudomonadota bacterium]